MHIDRNNVLVCGALYLCSVTGTDFFHRCALERMVRDSNYISSAVCTWMRKNGKRELMNQNRVKDGMMFKIENDPRIIGGKRGIGNFIRNYSIDEFPQFWNVLKRRHEPGWHQAAYCG